MWIYAWKSHEFEKHEKIFAFQRNETSRFEYDRSLSPYEAVENVFEWRNAPKRPFRKESYVFHATLPNS